MPTSSRRGPGKAGWLGGEVSVVCRKTGHKSFYNVALMVFPPSVDQQTLLLVTAALQAALDFKYLNDRYQKGRDSIRAHMEEKLMFHRCSSLVLAHSHIVEAQSKMGADGFLSWKHDINLKPFWFYWFNHRTHYFILLFTNDLEQQRLTILVGDCTLWPARCLDKHCSTNGYYVLNFLFVLPNVL